MRILSIICLALLASACTPHEIRCDGHLERINTVATTPNPQAALP